MKTRIIYISAALAGAALWLGLMVYASVESKPASIPVYINGARVDDFQRDWKPTSHNSSDQTYATLLTRDLRMRLPNCSACYAAAISGALKVETGKAEISPSQVLALIGGRESLKTLRELGFSSLTVNGVEVRL